MSQTMADVIAAHWAYELPSLEGRMFSLRCQADSCTWGGEFDYIDFAAHVADELTKAGFGSVRDAEAAAFEHAAVNIETYPLAEQYHPARAHLANHFRTKAVAWRQS